MDGRAGFHEVMTEASAPKVNREWVIQVLADAQASAEGRRRLLALEYPAPLDVVARALGEIGITKSAVIDRMGGSP